MRYAQASLAVLLAAAAVAAGDVRKVDPPPKADWQVIPADPVLTVLAADKPGVWELVDETPAASLRPIADGKFAAFAATAAGQYRVVVTGPDGPTRLKVVVPGPPQPLPGPGPVPPPVPPPVDPLVVRLSAAFALDPREAKLKDRDRVLLTDLYELAVELAAQAEVPTTAALVARIQEAAKILKIAGLKEVRVAIAAELAAQLGTDDAPLTSESRAKAAAVFTKIKTALEAVK